MIEASHLVAMDLGGICCVPHLSLFESPWNETPLDLAFRHTTEMVGLHTRTVS